MKFIIGCVLVGIAAGLIGSQENVALGGVVLVIGIVCLCHDVVERVIENHKKED